ncbi:MAG: tetratricopeptide repeat protein [Pseudomonadota bacterium]|nr:tetratricopeptide repeat protein [Pseudomonadota bacterium]
MNGGESESIASADLPSVMEPNSPAPEASTDKVSQYQRGLHFWTLGDYREAFPWFKSSADMGHREARYYLGLAYLYGRATIQNYRLAFEQMEASARQNHLDAQHRLGLMYRDDIGVAKNREQAYVWLNIAASRGHEVATQDRDKLAAGMSTDEIARAQDGTMKELANLRAVAAPKIAEISAAPAQ